VLDTVSYKHTILEVMRMLICEFQCILPCKMLIGMPINS